VYCECAPSFVCVCVPNQDYLKELQELLRSVSETDFKLNSPEYWPAAYYNLPQQEHCLKVSPALDSFFLKDIVFLFVHEPFGVYLLAPHIHPYLAAYPRQGHGGQKSK